MGNPQGPIPVRLTWAEAISVLVQVEKAGLSMGATGVSAAGKVRQALMMGGFDPGEELEIGCSEDEAAFLAKAGGLEQAG